MFQLFDCKVRLAGSLINEVPKKGVTAPEIALLRFLHGGDDMVTDIKALPIDAMVEDGVDAKGKPKKRPRTEQEERERLQTLYGPALRSYEDVRTIAGIFGAAGPLPKAVPGADVEVDLADEIVK